MVLLSGCAEHGKIEKKAQLTLWQTNIAMGNGPLEDVFPT